MTIQTPCTDQSKLARLLRLQEGQCPIHGCDLIDTHFGMYDHNTLEMLGSRKCPVKTCNVNGWENLTTKTIVLLAPDEVKGLKSNTSPLELLAEAINDE